MSQEERLGVAPDMWKHLNESASADDRKTRLRILVYPNMLERFAGMYNHGLFDDGIVKTQVQVDARYFWETAKWWIQLVQKEDENYLKDTEVMIAKLAHKSRPSPYQ
jgi:hypothetical protein